MEMEYSYDVIHGACSIVIIEHPWLKVVRLEDLLGELDTTARMIALWLFHDRPTVMQDLYTEALTSSFRNPNCGESISCHERGTSIDSWKATFDVEHRSSFESFFGNAARTCGFE